MRNSIGFRGIVAVALLALGLAQMGNANPTLIPGTWVNISPPVPFGTATGVCLNGLAIDHNNPSTIFICCGSFDPSESGLYKTTNGGSTWRKIPGVDGGARIRLDPKNSNHLYYAVGVRGAMGFYVSNDGGETWNQPQGYKDLLSQAYFADLYDISCNPTDFNHIIISFHGSWRYGDPTWGNSSGVIESKDGGNTWIVHEPNKDWGTGHSIAFLYNPDLGIGNSQTWLLGTQGPGYWKTTNSGASWKQVYPIGIQHGGGTIYYTKAGVLYASGADKNLRSLDNGESWTAFGNGGGYNCIYGDGTNLYTSKCFSGSPMLISPETDGNTWTEFNSQNFSQGPFEMELDPDNRILYASNWGAGLWALKLVTDKPIVQISGAPVSVTYTRGATLAQQSRTVTAINYAARENIHLAGPVTVTKKSSWLTVSVNAAKVDTQIITNTIDPSSFPDADAKYYDTVTVHAAGAENPDVTYAVTVWVRSTAAIASIVVTPESSSVAGGQSVQFTAKAIDQYGLELAQQPAFTWTTTGGSINGSGLYVAGGCIGSYTVAASALSMSQNASVTVTTTNCALTSIATSSSNENGHTARAAIDGIINGYPADASKEWSSNGEKAGAWVQLTWSTPVTVDSIALWDRPYPQDQVTGGTLTFSDGSSITVGTLVTDASAPWSQKFAPKTITRVKFTVTSVSASTSNVGLSEFEVFNTASCSTNLAVSINPSLKAGRLITVVPKGILVNAEAGVVWNLDLVALNGNKIAGYTGKGAKVIASVNPYKSAGFLIARLKVGGKEISERVICK